MKALSLTLAILILATATQSSVTNPRGDWCESRCTRGTCADAEMWKKCSAPETFCFASEIINCARTAYNNGLMTPKQIAMMTTVDKDFYTNTGDWCNSECTRFVCGDKAIWKHCYDVCKENPSTIINCAQTAYKNSIVTEMTDEQIDLMKKVDEKFYTEMEQKRMERKKVNH